MCNSIQWIAGPISIQAATLLERTSRADRSYVSNARPQHRAQVVANDEFATRASRGGSHIQPRPSVAAGLLERSRCGVPRVRLQRAWAYPADLSRMQAGTGDHRRRAADSLRLAAHRAGARNLLRP